MIDQSRLEILKSRDEQKMLVLAKDETCEAEALFVLSQSANADIRCNVAVNKSTPHHADELLAGDEDIGVRCGVARKIANRLTQHVSDKQRAAALQVLTRLIADQEVRVRKVIAEEIKASDLVPKDILLKLAMDEASEVSCPVLEYSPLLEDEDLIGIIKGLIHSPALESIANRNNVSEIIAEKLIVSMDANAITALLRNPNAQIREDTLDRILEAADTVESWHAPLIARPGLSFRAIKRICNFITENLMQEFARRADIDEEMREYITEKVTARLEAEDINSSDQKAVAEIIREELLNYKKAGTLDADYFSQAADQEKHMNIWIGLALLVDIDHTIAHRIFATRSAKAITALCWKAQMPMWLAFKLQDVVGKIAPEDCLEPDKDGGYPLRDDELEWHFALFTEEDEQADENVADAAETG